MTIFIQLPSRFSSEFYIQIIHKGVKPHKIILPAPKEGALLSLVTAFLSLAPPCIELSNAPLPAPDGFGLEPPNLGGGGAPPGGGGGPGGGRPGGGGGGGMT